MSSHDKMIDLAEKCFDEIKNAVVPIYTIKNRSSFAVFGSAFLATYEQDVYIISAQHVIKIAKEKRLFTIINGSFFELSDLKFFLAEKEDIAIAKLTPNWCQKRIKKEDCLDLVQIRNEIPIYPEPTITRYLLLGFFASNKYDLKTFVGSCKRMINGISFYERKQSIDCKTTISNAIAFDFSLSDLLTGDRKKTNIDKLNGNSGGSVFEVTAYEKHNKLRYSYDFIGVFVEYHKKEHEIIISPKANIIKLIHSVTPADLQKD